MTNTSTRDSLRFSETVPPGETSTLSVEMEDPATIDRVRVRLYPGTQLALQIRPVVRINDEDEILIPRLFGRNYITGDGDTWNLETSEPVEQGDVVAVEVTNTDSQYAYDYSVDMTLDRAGGSGRSLVGMLAGVFN
ncbi:hypothetical protein [Halomarina oriensis]|uniref:Uncharacterized protein n=1 Tax=Halomarina oriensis TaxID=671145 RepID=A0A6B0GS19_9EURY|nr:hypothetical protein [Halomarina oriensis]MWG36951.1 hypothetical protein [Halomarina oriensis]